MMMLAMIVRKNRSDDDVTRSRSDDDVSYDSEEEHEEQK